MARGQASSVAIPYTTKRCERHRIDRCDGARTFPRPGKGPGR